MADTSSRARLIHEARVASSLNHPHIAHVYDVGEDRDHVFIDEDDRWGFIYLHLWQVMRAMSAGVPVAGYLYWSLLDNYEWLEGYKARFGLIGVNFETQDRLVRPSVRWLAEVIEKRSL